jgi:hypothetical protein
MIIGNRGLARIDRVAAGNLVEGVDGERRRPVGGRQQIRVDTQRGARLQVGGLEILVDAVRPHDLFGRGHPPRRALVRPIDRWLRLQRALELAPADGKDPAAPADLFLF